MSVGMFLINGGSFTFPSHRSTRAESYKMDNPRVTFFMLVTNRDAVIADYCIQSYQRLYDEFKDDVTFVLYIYCNCLTDATKQKYVPRWSRLDYVKIFDNHEKMTTIQIQAGETITSPEGINRVRDGWCENYDELWTSELKNFKTDYIATVDADFEILRPDFVKNMIDVLHEDPNLIGMSSDYTPPQYACYEPYSDRVINIAERWNTWFCIYKIQAFSCSASHFYLEEVDSNGEKLCFDSSGYFQHRLITDFGYRFAAVDPKFRKQFIHYSAFSKNRSINDSNIGLYRRLAILRQNGLQTHFEDLAAVKSVNKIVRAGARLFILTYFNESERMKYDFSKD